ncbi:uncharacterized protein Dana_GF14162, isoform C [Drosophila ananassae]|uniref:Reticulon-like protein n=1 Tax=Drosophila ananassae TaxID=7217 RepID=A0A0P8XGC5_DROAN|nr:reticulon-1 isoform X2 [Drosophila ananassae]KPU73839.1 uncharacterized protein Dana_GF14162, isoform C [Drosophila ananassae]
MDINFSELKKEAAAASEDVFQRAQKAYEEMDLGLGGDAGNVSGGAQDDNAHTEHYFANEQKKLDFGDPQEFVQRMSAGAKEAQELLEAKFAKKADDFDDFLSDAGKDVKQSIGGLTTDFMNAERGLFGGSNTAPLAPFSEAAAVSPPVEAPAPAPAPEKAAAPAPATATAPIEEDLLGSFSDKPSAPLQAFQPTSNFYDDDDDDFSGKPLAPTPAAAAPAPVSAPAAAAAPFTANKDSDTESPSVSYTPSPAKKPVVDALKEQDNEKFISSEDLLSDFRDERTATPPAVPATVPAATPAAPKPVPVPVAAPVSAASLVTDLDDDDDFKPSVQAAPKAEPKPEPPKVKEEPPKPNVAPPPVPAAASSQSQSQSQPKIVSVEEIFYKYGLVESLIYWRDVKKSGIVFGAGLITLLAISSFSVISVFAYLSLLTLFGTVAFRIYKSVTQAVQKTNDGHPFKEYLDLDLTLSQEKVQNIAGVAVAHINGFVAELRRLFLVEDLIDSIKFGVILWVFTYIGAWFNGMTLVLLAFVSLFTLPKVYENNKQSIDTYLDLVRSKLTEITDKIRVAIPIGKNKPVAAESDKDK